VTTSHRNVGVNNVTYMSKCHKTSNYQFKISLSQRFYYFST